ECRNLATSPRLRQSIHQLPPAQPLHPFLPPHVPSRSDCSTHRSHALSTTRARCLTSPSDSESAASIWGPPWELLHWRPRRQDSSALISPSQSLPSQRDAVYPAAASESLLLPYRAVTSPCN